MRPIFHQPITKPLHTLKTPSSISSSPTKPPLSLSSPLRRRCCFISIKFQSDPMAQKTGQEEAEFKSVPETLNLCVNNCGVTGNPSTNNMCQNCFNSTTATSAVSTAASSILSSPSSSLSAGALKFEKSLRSTILPPCTEPDLEPKVDLVKEVREEIVVVKRVVNRCSGCKRKVGLTGFRCRCGELFCSEHRYSDRHDCSYDYKAAGREAIARENPVVRAAKIVKV